MGKVAYKLSQNTLNMSILEAENNCDKFFFPRAMCRFSCLIPTPLPTTPSPTTTTKHHYPHHQLFISHHSFEEAEGNILLEYNFLERLTNKVPIYNFCIQLFISNNLFEDAGSNIP